MKLLQREIDNIYDWSILNSLRLNVKQCFHIWLYKNLWCPWLMSIVSSITVQNRSQKLRIWVYIWIVNCQFFNRYPWSPMHLETGFSLNTFLLRWKMVLRYGPTFINVILIKSKMGRRNVAKFGIHIDDRDNHIDYNSILRNEHVIRNCFGCRSIRQITVYLVHWIERLSVEINK